MGEMRTWRDRPWLYAIYWWWLGVRGTFRYWGRRLGILPPLTEEQKRAMLPLLADNVFKASPLLVIGRVRKRPKRRRGDR